MLSPNRPQKRELLDVDGLPLPPPTESGIAEMPGVDGLREPSLDAPDHCVGVWHPPGGVLAVRLDCVEAEAGSLGDLGDA